MRLGRGLFWGAGVVAVGAVTAAFVSGSTVLPDTRPAVPTAKVVRGSLKLTVYATGELRAGRTVNQKGDP